MEWFVKLVIFFFLSPASRTHSKMKKWVWIGAWLDGALQTPSAGTLTRAWGSLVCTKKKKDSQLLNKVRLEAHSFWHHFLPPCLRIRGERTNPQVFARDLDCMMELHLTEIFIYIQKSVSRCQCWVITMWFLFHYFCRKENRHVQMLPFLCPHLI